MSVARLDDRGLADARLTDKDRLFLVRRLSTWMTRRISLSRPTTGSSLPSRARAVRSVEYSPEPDTWPGSALVTRGAAAP